MLDNILRYCFLVIFMTLALLITFAEKSGVYPSSVRLSAPKVLKVVCSIIKPSLPLQTITLPYKIR